MPQYNWKCQKCSHINEITRPVSEYQKPPEKCEKCDNTDEFEKQIGSTAFILRGGGWFKTGGY